MLVTTKSWLSKAVNDNVSAPQEKGKEEKELAQNQNQNTVATTQTQGFTSLANKNCETCKDQLNPSAEDFSVSMKTPPPGGPTQWKQFIFII